MTYKKIVPVCALHYAAIDLSEKINDKLSEEFSVFYCDSGPRNEGCLKKKFKQLAGYSSESADLNLIVFINC